MDCSLMSFITMIDTRTGKKRMPSVLLCSIGVFITLTISYLQPISAQNNPRQRVSLLNKKAVGYYQKQKYRLAEKTWLRAIKLARKKSFHNYEYHLLKNMSNIKVRQTDKQPAIRILKRMIRISRKLKNEKELSNSLYRLGVLQADIGKPKASLNTVKKALTLFRKLNDREGIHLSLGAIGRAHTDLMNYSKAILYISLSSKLKGESDDVIGLAINSLNLGAVHLRLGNMQQSLDATHKALRLFIKSGNRSKATTAMANLGYLYSTLRDSQKALVWFQRAQKNAEKEKNKRDLCLVLGLRAKE